MKKIYKIKIIIFAFIIAIPVITFNFKKDQISEIDNRALVDLEDVFKDEDITVGIENFVDDRIGFRNSMVNLYTKSMDILFGDMVHPSYQYGRDGYVFSKVEEEEFNHNFQEVFVNFIQGFQNYCESRGIDFLYAVEPSKESIYSEYLPIGYNRSNENLAYFLRLLKNSNINYTNNVDNLLNYKNEALLYDKKYDARHWNETGAIVGISSILKDLNSINNEVEVFDFSNFEAEHKINEFLPNSKLEIHEETTTYNLKNDVLESVNDFNGEITLDRNYHNFDYYKNKSKDEGPRVLIFAGSYFNNKEKFLINSFSEIIRIHNYRNVVDYEYYINIFNPDIVLFESTEYTHMSYYFPISGMAYKVQNRSLEEYRNLYEDEFVAIDESKVEKSGNNITNISIPIENKDLLYAYANFNDRVLDCKITEKDEGIFLEVSIMTSELEGVESLNLYFISKDEQRYQKSEIPL